VIPDLRFVYVLCSERFVERIADETIETLETFGKRRSYAPVSCEGGLIHSSLQLHRTCMLC